MVSPRKQHDDAQTKLQMIIEVKNTVFVVLHRWQTEWLSTLCVWPLTKWLRPACPTTPIPKGMATTMATITTDRMRSRVKVMLRSSQLVQPPSPRFSQLKQLISLNQLFLPSSWSKYIHLQTYCLLCFVREILEWAYNVKNRFIISSVEFFPKDIHFVLTFSRTYQR